MKGLAPLLMIGLAGLAWLIFISESGSHWLTSIIAPPENDGAVVGKVVNFEGTIRHIHGGEFQKLEGPSQQTIELHDGDRLETEKNSRALVLLNSQDEMELKALTSMTLQLWNEKDPASALYITLLNGDLNLRKPGVRGRAYLVREGRLYLPGQKAVKKPLSLTVLKSAPQDLALANEKPLEMGTEFEPDSSTAADKIPVGFSSEPETLSNEYIDEMIVSRQAQLQKCWLSRLKDRPEKKGQIVLQFEISRRGKVKEIKVADSTLADENLQKCVMSVVERITFRTFKGPEISLSYPINFE